MRPTKTSFTKAYFSSRTSLRGARKRLLENYRIYDQSDGLRAESSLKDRA